MQTLLSPQAQCREYGIPMSHKSFGNITDIAAISNGWFDHNLRSFHGSLRCAYRGPLFCLGSPTCGAASDKGRNKTRCTQGLDCRPAIDIAPISWLINFPPIPDSRCGVLVRIRNGMSRNGMSRSLFLKLLCFCNKTSLCFTGSLCVVGVLWGTCLGLVIF